MKRTLFATTDLLKNRIPERFFSSCLSFFLLFALLPVIGCGDQKPDGASGSDSTATHDSAGTAGKEVIGEEVKDDGNSRYALRLTPKAGDIYTYQVTRQQGTSTEGFKSSQQEIYDFTLRVVNVNDDHSMVLGVRYDRVRATITQPTIKPDSTGKKPILDSTGKAKLFEETIRFDTQGKENIPGGERYKAFVGRETLVTMDGDGKVQDVANVDPILNATLKALRVSADTINPKALEMARQGIRFEIGTLISLLFFKVSPDSAVGVGASWSQSDSIPVAGGLPAKTTYTYTLAGIREAEGERLAQVKAVLKTQAQIPKKSIDNEYLTMKIESITVGGEGESIVSVATGFPITRKSSIQANMSGTGGMKQGPDKGKTQRVTYKESTVTSIKRVAYKPGA